MFRKLALGAVLVGLVAVLRKQAPDLARYFRALDVKTGETRWQHRGFGRASLLQAGSKTIILDEDGDLALATMTPEGVTIHSEAKLFETTAWTVPTLVGTTLYARDREKIVALDLGAR